MPFGCTVVCEADKQHLFGVVVKQILGQIDLLLSPHLLPRQKLNISKYLGKCHQQVMPGDYAIKAEAPRPHLDDKGCRNNIHLVRDFYCRFSESNIR